MDSSLSKANDLALFDSSNVSGRCFARQNQIPGNWYGSLRPFLVYGFRYAIDAIEDQAPASYVWRPNGWITLRLCRSSIMQAIDNEFAYIVEGLSQPCRHI